MAESAHPAFLPFLVQELRRLHREKRSGTLFATTMNQRLAQFGIEQGEIVYLSFQNVEGEDGLLLMLAEQQTGAGVARFAEGRHRGARLNLPATEELLNRLVPGSVSPPADATGQPQLTQAIRELIERELTEMIGPYASVLCQEVWDSAATIEQALAALGKELPEPELAVRLRQNVARALR